MFCVSGGWYLRMNKRRENSSTGRLLVGSVLMMPRGTVLRVTTAVNSGSEEVDLQLVF